MQEGEYKRSGVKTHPHSEPTVDCQPQFRGWRPTSIGSMEWKAGRTADRQKRPRSGSQSRCAQNHSQETVLCHRHLPCHHRYYCGRSDCHAISAGQAFDQAYLRPLLYSFHLIPSHTGQIFPPSDPIPSSAATPASPQLRVRPRCRRH
jgi:hypothetical protein